MSTGLNWLKSTVIWTTEFKVFKSGVLKRVGNVLMGWAIFIFPRIELHGVLTVDLFGAL
jgi:hypothetical protein